MTTTSSISSTISSILSSAASHSTSSSSVVSSSSSGYELYTQKVVNPVKPSIEDAPQIGYLDKNKSALEVQGTITRQDTTNYFSFSYRTGDSITLVTNINKGVRVQLLDSSGYHVLADSSGTNATLKNAYSELKNGTLDLKNGNYLIKVTYDSTANKNKTLNYDLTLASGTSFKTKYKTYALATTVYNTLLEGGDTGIYSSAGLAASLLYSQQEGDDINIMDYLS